MVFSIRSQEQDKAQHILVEQLQDIYVDDVAHYL